MQNRCDFAVKGFNDSHWREFGTLTETFDIVTGHPRLLRSLSWNDPDYEGNVLEMIKSIIDADPDNYANFLILSPVHAPKAVNSCHQLTTVHVELYSRRTYSKSPAKNRTSIWFP